MKNALTTLIYFFFFSFGFAQNGQIISKKMVDLKNESFWDNLTINDSLKPKYHYLYNLDFYEIEYLSDSLSQRLCS